MTPNPADPPPTEHPPTDTGPTGPIPEDNRPGHHPAVEQDQPDPDAFAARIGVAVDDGGRADERPGSDTGPGAAVVRGVVAVARLGARLGLATLAGTIHGARAGWREARRVLEHRDGEAREPGSR